jgi:hypothetical protein
LPRLLFFLRIFFLVAISQVYHRRSAQSSSTRPTNQL